MTALTSSITSTITPQCDRSLIEDLSLALVREYLAKKKYRTTLDCLASELPTKPTPTTTTALARNLGITKFVTKNSKAQEPFQTLLEIFAEYMYKKYGGAKEDEKPGGVERVASKVSSNGRVNESKVNDTPPPATVRTASTLSQRPFIASSSTATAPTLRDTSSTTAISPRSPITSSSSAPIRNTSSISARSSNHTTTSSSITSSAPRHILGGNIAGQEDDSSSTPVSASSFARPGSASRNGRTATTSTSTTSTTPAKPSPLSSTPLSSSSKLLSSTPVSSTKPSSTSKHVTRDSDLMIEEDFDYEEEMEQMEAASKADSQSGTMTKPPSAHTSSSSLPPSTPLSLDIIHSYKSLIFGTSHLTGTFTDPWLQQGFVLKSQEITSKAPNLKSGLVQHQGGPCGVIAVVQGFVMKELLYNSKSGDSFTSTQRYDLLSSCTQDHLKTALISALTEILWLCSDAGKAPIKLCTKSSTPQTRTQKKYANGTIFKPDGVSEYLQVCDVRSRDAVMQFFHTHYTHYTQPRGCGVVLFLYSCLLTRGIVNIETDRDAGGSTSLIGAHSYCTQELVNLLLTGKAVSNVFNGEKNFDGLILKGIEKRAQIGFLSLFEFYESIEVGENLKTPLVPIWIVCSESHYSVLWSVDRAILDPASSSKNGRFDLLYYDELANQKEEIRLTIDVSNKKALPSKSSDDLEPPINECIRTKWTKYARVDWNGSEPIL